MSRPRPQYVQRRIRAEELRAGDRLLSHGRALVVEKVILVDEAKMYAALSHGWIKSFGRDELVHLAAPAAER
jgi:hypothetical protein